MREELYTMKIVLLGEPMGLFMANETGAISEVKTFTASIAGAEYNVAVGLARLGHTPAYCTRLGFDPMGEKILNGLRQNGISTDLVMQAEGELTGLMMKSSTQKGDPDIAYYRKGSAASKISPHDIDGLDLYGCERLHVTGIFPAVSESALSATRRLISRAQALGIPYSFDPNLRPQLWADRGQMVQPGPGRGDSAARHRGGQTAYRPGQPGGHCRLLPRHGSEKRGGKAGGRRRVLF